MYQNAQVITWKGQKAFCGKNYLGCFLFQEWQENGISYHALLLVFITSGLFASCTEYCPCLFFPSLKHSLYLLWVLSFMYCWIFLFLSWGSRAAVPAYEVRVFFAVSFSPNQPPLNCLQALYTKETNNQQNQGKHREVCFVYFIF